MQENARKKSESRKVGRRVEWRELRQKTLPAVARQLLFGVFGILLAQGEMLFGSYPMGIALLTASGRYTLACLVGLLIGSWLGPGDPLVYLCTYVALALIRGVGGMLLDAPEREKKLKKSLKERLISFINAEENEEGGEQATEPEAPRRGIRALFDEGTVFRMGLAATGGFVIGMYRVIHDGFRYYDLFALVFLLLVVPSLSFAYRYAVEKREGVPSFLTVASEGVLLFSLVWSARSIVVFGVSLASALALFFTIQSAARRGVYQGIGASILCGVAYHPLYAPAYLIAALVYLTLQRLGRARLAVLGGAMGALFWFTYLDGGRALVLFLPTFLTVGVLFQLLEGLSGGTATEEMEENREVGERDRRILSDHRHQDAKERFRGISEALSGLSEMLYNLSDRFRRPGTLDLRRICDRSMDRFCASCPSREICWGLEYSETLELVNRLIGQLHTKGRVDGTQVPSHLRHRCASMTSILEEINAECGRVTYEMLRNNRTEIFAMDYEAAAEIINDALEEDEGEYAFDPEEEQKVAEYLTDAGVKYRSVTVYGNRRRQIVVRNVEIENATVSTETMRSDLAEMCGVELGAPLFEVEDGVSRMILRNEKRFSVEGAQNNVSADGGVSGDSLALFSNRKEYFYALINDGMGAGRTAALTSNLCSVFLEKMLRAGNRATTSLRMLNNMIRSRAADSTEETSSTVDLLELDLMTGEANFLKSGAAPSFVVRGGNVHCIRSGTAPIGIIRSLDVQSTPFRLKEGDTVVMISDGILEKDPDCHWLRTYLAGVGSETPEEIVYRICLFAAGSAEHDDCSALTLRIGPAESEKTVE